MDHDPRCVGGEATQKLFSFASKNWEIFFNFPPSLFEKMYDSLAAGQRAVCCVRAARSWPIALMWAIPCAGHALGLVGALPNSGYC